MPRNDRDFIGAIEKGLAAIEAFDAASQRMTLSELARKTGLTRPTARRHLLSLVRLNYAATDGKLFWLTHRVLRLGFAYLSSSSLPRAVQPVLDRIAESTKEAASLSTLDDAEIIFVASSIAPRVMAATINVGLRLPAYCTASGRVLLASLCDEDAERRLKLVPRKRLTAKTKTSVDQLMQEIGKVRINGYAVNDEEREVGLRSISVPVATPLVTGGLALTVSVHAGRISTADMLNQILPKLRAGKQRLERVL